MFETLVIVAFCAEMLFSFIGMIAAPRGTFRSCFTIRWPESWKAEMICGFQSVMFIFGAYSIQSFIGDLIPMRTIAIDSVASSFFSAVLFAPVLEEFTSRGYEMEFFRRLVAFRAAAVITSILFGLCHFTWMGAAACGLYACYLRVRTRGLVVPIVFHALFNLKSVMFEALLPIIPAEGPTTWAELSTQLAITLVLIVIGLPGLKKIWVTLGKEPARPSFD